MKFMLATCSCLNGSSQLSRNFFQTKCQQKKDIIHKTASLFNNTMQPFEYDEGNKSKKNDVHAEKRETRLLPNMNRHVNLADRHLPSKCIGVGSAINNFAQKQPSYMMTLNSIPN